VIRETWILSLVTNNLLRRVLLIVLAVVSLTLPGVVLAFSDAYFLQGSVESSQRLFEVGMIIAGVLCFLGCLLSTYVSTRFMLACREHLRKIAEGETKPSSEEQLVFLKLSLRKINSSLVSVFVVSLMVLLFTCTMAFYQDFFSNTTLSKAFCLIFLIFWDGAHVFQSTVFLI